MGRIVFGLVLAGVGALYLALAGVALWAPGGFLAGDAWWGVLLFLIAGIVAAGAAVSLLRGKQG